jgi:hypothetical protein
LRRVNDCGRLGGTALRRFGGGIDLQFLGNCANLELNIQSARLTYLEYDIVDDFGCKFGASHCDRVLPNRQAGEAVIPVRIGLLLFANASDYCQDLYPRAPHYSTRWIRHRAFEDRTIDLRDR